MAQKLREQQAFTGTRTQSQQSTYNQRNNRQYPPANNHRAGHYSGTHPEDTPYQSSEVDGIEEDDSFYEQRSRSSVKRYDQQQGAPIRQRQVRYDFHPDEVQPMPQRRTAPSQTQAKPVTEDVPAARTKKSKRSGLHVHWSVFLGLGMIVMLGLWVAGTSFMSWWQVHQDDAQYGRPRTAQYDVVVGHGDSTTNPTHFIALNLNSKVEIIEMPGGNAAKSRVYTGPQLFGPSSDLYPVTLTFQDTNGDGKPDMQVHVDGATIYYLNQNGQFVSQPTH